MWKRRSPAPGARTIAFAERPNLTIITARHYSRVEVQADGPRPILADVAKASADELRAAWGPFVSEAGTYEVTPGGLITMRPIASKNPAVMGPGVFITYSYKLDGDTLSLTQQRNQNGPFANPFTSQVDARRMNRFHSERKPLVVLAHNRRDRAAV